MNRATRALFLALCVSAVMTGAAAAKPGGISTVALNNGQETTDAKFGGSGSFIWWVDGNALCYELSVKNLTAAPLFDHIHIGDKHVAGPVVVTLMTPPAATSIVTECITADAEGEDMTSAELAAIVANPGAYYVNVHTPLFPGGEVRGQLK